jgi:uncharacterized protein
VGPTNIALVKFHQADLVYRAAMAKLDAVSKNVRLQENKVNYLRGEHDTALKKSAELEGKARDLENDLRSRESRIDQLRQAQTNATDNKVYQQLIIEINTQKLDKGKIEEQALAAMEIASKQRTVLSGLKTQVEAETAKLELMRAEIDAKVKELTAEAESVKGPRDELAAVIPAKMLDIYVRMADRLDGEAMAKIEKPRPKVEEYDCGGCNMSLVVDIYNRLHTRDDIVQCPSCGRLLYIPEDLPPEKAVNKKKPVAPRKPKAKKEAAPATNGSAQPAAPTEPSAPAAEPVQPDAAPPAPDALEASDASNA